MTDFPNDNNAKSYNLPLQQIAKAPAAVVKAKSPSRVLIPKSASKPTTLANRLIQKRKSVERKIEEMRKQKIEAEMKEVQQKPKISAKSRILAEQAEKKHSTITKLLEKPQQEIKHYCDEEMIELEEDIQLLEECLNMEKPKTSQISESFPKKSSYFSQFATMENMNHKEVRAKSPVILNKSPAKPPSKRKVAEESPMRAVQKTPKRKFIKKNSSKTVKHRSSSMGTLAEINFAYRSISPYQVSIKRS